MFPLDSVFRTLADPNVAGVFYVEYYGFGPDDGWDENFPLRLGGVWVPDSGSSTATQGSARTATAFVGTASTLQGSAPSLSAEEVADRFNAEAAAILEENLQLERDLDAGVTIDGE